MTIFAKIVVISLLLITTVWADRDEDKTGFQHHHNGFASGQADMQTETFVQPSDYPLPPRFAYVPPATSPGMMGGMAGSASNINPLTARLGTGTGTYIGNGTR